METLPPGPPATTPSRTPDFSSLLGLDEPLVNAPMAGAAGGALAAAVSRAGGLGMIGIGGGATDEWIRTESAVAVSSGRPWGAGLMAWVLEGSLRPLEVLLESSPALVCVSFGDPGPAAALIKGSGALSAMQIGNDVDLQRALEDDIDVVVCRGSEGGGHGRNEVATLPLLQVALEATEKPVLAAGGIATSGGVAAVLAAGAQSAWVGTRFAACVESLSHDTAKAAIAAAGLDDTVYTRAFDIAQRIPWPAEFGGRALRNHFSDEWTDRTDELAHRVAANPSITDAVSAARRGGDVGTAPVYAGQSAALSRGRETAAQIVGDLSGFREHLRSAATRWVSEP